MRRVLGEIYRVFIDESYTHRLATSFQQSLSHFFWFGVIFAQNPTSGYFHLRFDGMAFLQKAPPNHSIHHVALIVIVLQAAFFPPDEHTFLSLNTHMFLLHNHSERTSPIPLLQLAWRSAAGLWRKWRYDQGSVISCRRTARSDVPT